MRVWEVSQHADGPVLRGHTSYVYPVALSPDGRWIASGSWDNTVRLWDAMTGESCAILPHPGSVRALAFGPDSSWLVSGCYLDESLWIWKVATAQLEKKFKGPGSIFVQALAVSPDGARIAAADRTEARGSSKPRPASKSTPFGWPQASARKSRWPTVQTDDFWRVPVKSARK